MNKEEFIRINIEEGFTKLEAENLWLTRPYQGDIIPTPEDIIRQVAKRMLPDFIWLRNESNSKSQST